MRGPVALEGTIEIPIYIYIYIYVHVYGKMQKYTIANTH